EDLAVLRNDIAHAKVEILPNWDSLIKRLIPFLPRIRHLLQLIEAVTEKPYTGV
ncbi:MAG: hypothetical protein QOC99_2880, partial [Acidobacteriota bacterium]|nr:hypothetical protein [Acidobacteriota bacterium]